MKTYIMAHPIDVPLQQRLRIYDSSFVANTRVGAVINQLAMKGYIHVRVDVCPEKGKIYIYCNQKSDEER